MTVSGLVLPRWEETLALEDLAVNCEETVKYMNQFKNDIDILTNAYDKCKNTLEEEYNGLLMIINEKKDNLENIIYSAFNQRLDKLNKQLSMLEAHLNENEKCEKECRELIVTMTKSSQMSQRIEQIRDKCHQCTKNTPKIYTISNELKLIHPNSKNRSKIINKEMGKYFSKLETTSKVTMDRNNEFEENEIKFKVFNPILSNATQKGDKIIRGDGDHDGNTNTDADEKSGINTSNCNSSYNINSGGDGLKDESQAEENDKKEKEDDKNIFTKDNKDDDKQERQVLLKEKKQDNTDTIRMENENDDDVDSEELFMALLHKSELPKSIKIKCDMTINGEKLRKSWKFLNNEDLFEYSRQHLLEKARKFAKPKKRKLKFVFNIGDKTIKNDRDFIRLCAMAKDPTNVKIIATIAK